MFDEVVGELREDLEALIVVLRDRRVARERPTEVEEPPVVVVLVEVKYPTVGGADRDLQVSARQDDGGPAGRIESWRRRRRPSASLARQAAGHSSAMRRLEKLDWIAVWIQDLNLPACWPGFHGVPKRRSGAAQCFDDRGQVFHAKNDAVRAAGTLPLAARQEPRSRCPRATEMDS
jgi:hypothetical protein